MKLPDTRIFIAKESVHMGRSFDGLQKLVDALDVSGNVVVFFANKRGTAAKVYWRDENGQSIFYKRLDKRVLRLPSFAEGAKRVHIDKKELLHLLDGIPLPPKNASRRKIAHEARESALRKLNEMAEFDA